MDRILYEKILTGANLETCIDNGQIFRIPTPSVEIGIPICKCKERVSITKERKVNKRVEPFQYPARNPIPNPDEVDEEKIEKFLEDVENRIVKTFQIKYERKLSSIANLLLNSFQNKYLYYAIDDILYLLKSNPVERDNLLGILYSPVLSLQNNLSINFFEIWIDEIYINEIPKVNKFLTNNGQNFEPFCYITIKLLYTPTKPIKQKESLW